MRIGVDLGGTKIEGIVLDDAGQERARLRSTPQGSYEETVQAVAGVVRSSKPRSARAARRHRPSRRRLAGDRADQERQLHTSTAIR
jgi:fructokinase